MNASASVISEEVRRFDDMAAEWWDPKGPMAPLHRINPIRLRWLRDAIASHFGQTPRGQEGPLEGLTLVDIGCGAGLLSEPLSRLGLVVTGLEPAPTSIEIARAHADATGAPATYRLGTVEDLAAEGAKFDVVLAMEVVEHVNDMPTFVATAARLVKPGGLMALSTLNRTAKSFALAIIGAEYVLRWLPPGTHHWEQFVTPDELEAALRDAGLTKPRRQGMVFEPLRNTWRLSDDCSVNYFMTAAG